MGKSYLALFILSPLVFADYYNGNSLNVLSPTYNSLGQTGLIHIPTGEIQKEGTVGFTIGNSSINQFISVVATPLSWLEASFFYHRPRDTYFIKKGKYLDKGFNVKILLLEYGDIDLSAGIDDISGTGYLSKEYFAGTLNRNNYKVTLGVGTGQLSKGHAYENPFKKFRQRYSSSSTDKNDYGSEVNYSTFFKGDVGIFGGVEYYSRKYPGLIFKIENNPYDYNLFLAGGRFTRKSANKRSSNRNFNVGIQYEFRNQYSLSISQFKGNSFDLKISKKINFDQPRRSVKPNQVKKISSSSDPKLAFYQDILRNFETDNLYLQAAEVQSDELKLAVVNNNYANPKDVFDHAQLVTKKLSEIHELEFKRLSLINVVNGIESGSISADMQCKCNNKRVGSIELKSASNNYQDYEFQTILKFPEIYKTIKPHFEYRYGDPARFFAAGLDATLDLEIKFSSSMFLTTGIYYQLFNSFDKLRDIPESPYLPHVRTDYVKYLDNRSDFYLKFLQLHKVVKLKNDHYFKATAGIFELMFGGYGFEYYWKPFTKNLSIGFNMYHVKQRDFKQQFGFLDYEVVTGHSNIIYFHEDTGLSVDLSLGRYLAGDNGYTFDLSKKFISGFKMGAYFTRTNISKKEYGEGSFDKGFYFEVPFQLFSKESGKENTRILIQPLTRDGGAKLKTKNPLVDQIFGGARNEYSFYQE